ncbi:MULTISPECIES: hypothetical protein [unclassified Mesorhizobium]|uniref:hypothetical protein n=1 Tax=unclassified Mesorhizobium TaxID=325217 RepID=UPI0003CE99AE|nr:MULTISPECIES: hypothetical protein [unclassified Mesorhizobium]ESY56616.1 hypothetical protein X745_06230 [Mesorhizobium sp. LNJC374B00]ESY61277.1 hypothetical protein X744_05955 [Mesorhizobium sp. LNJC372A00]WJI80800.1 hypothetical protein NLY34_28935 [Mesorhizobium sp. C374B]WJI87339.1 hypothetical protein NLY42_31330 [Mesorhizobium sp. C372A]
MTLSFAAAKPRSAKRFSDAAGDTDVSETTPATITPKVERLAALVGASAPAFVPVVDDPYGLYGFCNTGVLEKVRNDGGGICFGWIIWEWPGVFLTAEFHAVWLDGAGQYVDITPKPQNERRIVFAPAPEHEADFDFNARPLNARLRTYGDRSEEIRLRVASLGDTKRRYEERRAEAKGMTIQEWLTQKLPTDPVIGLVDSFLEACDKFDQHMDRLSDHNRNFTPDRTWYLLGERRAQLLTRIRRQLKSPPP